MFEGMSFPQFLAYIGSGPTPAALRVWWALVRLGFFF
jgi:hypothetical protein